MLFSVLIANYNNSRFLGTALKSVLEQSYPHWEIILVDDGSTDHFEEAISPFKADKRIRIFRNDKNEGCGYTKRKCAVHASGSVLAFLDPDDALHPEALGIMMQAHRERPECSLIYSTHYVCNDALIAKRIADYPRALPPQTTYLLLHDGSIHHFASFKKNAYLQTSGISPLNNKAVDQDLYYKLEETGAVFFINKSLYYYRIHRDSISNMGKEAEAVLHHYSIIEEACLRRMAKWRSAQLPDSRYWIKKYRTQYHKTRMFRSFRKKQWLSFFSSMLVFPFVGGWGNLISYCRKLPKEGFAIVKKSFTGNYEIKA